SVVFGNTTVTIPTDGANVTVTGEHGTLTINNTGAYTYDVDETATETLNVGDTESDLFTYIVSDGVNADDTSTLTVTVEGRDDAPVINSITAEDSSGVVVNYGLDINKDGIVDTLSATDLLSQDKGLLFSEDNGNLKIDMGTGGTDMSIDYHGGRAGFDNILGFYKIDPVTGEATDFQVLHIEDGSTKSTGANLGVLEDLEGEVGFFLIPDGQDKAAIINALTSGATITNIDGTTIHFSDGTSATTPVYYTDNNLSTDGRDHAVAGVGENGGITIGFEDLPSGSTDQDYDDFVITIKHCDKVGDNGQVFTNVSLSDTDNTNLQSATVILKNAQDADTLSVDNLPAGITANIIDNDDGTITVEFTGSATIAAYETALETISFASNDDNREPRNFSIEISDGLKTDLMEKTVNIGGCEIHPYDNYGEDVIVTLEATSTVTEGETITYTVSLNKIPTTDMTITLSNGETVEIKAGTRSGTVTIDAPSDDVYIDPSVEKAHITATTGGGFSSVSYSSDDVSTSVVDDNDPTVLTLNDVTVFESDGTNISNIPHGISHVIFTLENGRTVKVEYEGDIKNPTDPMKFIDAIEAQYGPVDHYTIKAGTAHYDSTGNVVADIPNQATVEFDYSYFNADASDIISSEPATATITASLDHTPQTTLVVTLDNGATITFEPDYVPGTNVTSTPFVIQGDDVYNDGESYTVSVDSTNGGGNFESLDTTDTATVTINDTIDVTTVNLSTTDVTEDDVNVTFTATLTHAAQGNVSVVTTQGTITILDGETVGSITVNTQDSDVYVDPDSISATITSATGGNFENLVIGTDSASAQIADTINDTTLTLADVNVNEGSGTATITATLTAAPKDGPLVVTLDNGAIITFAVGETTGTSTPFAIQGDDVYKDSSSATVSVQSYTGGSEYENLVTTDTSTVTVNDTIDTVYVKLVNDSEVTEGDGNNLTHKIMLVDINGNPVSVPTGEHLTVTLTYQMGTGLEDSDFEINPDNTQIKTVSVYLTDGMSEIDITNIVKDDLLDENNEAYTLSIGTIFDFMGQTFENIEAHPTENSVTGTIIDNDTDYVPEINPDAVQLDEDALLGTSDADNYDPDIKEVTAALNIDVGDDGLNSIKFASQTSITDKDGNVISSQGEDIVVRFDGNNQTLVGEAHGEKIFEITLDENTHEYTFKLLGAIDHPDMSSEDLIEGIEFTVIVEDNDGDISEGKIKVDIADDIPCAHDTVSDIDLNSNVVNLVFTLDISGSMGDDSKLESSKTAINNLIESYEAKGFTANVQINTFATAASGTGDWMNATQAAAFLTPLTSAGWTNYEDALQTTQDNFTSPSTGTTHAYFLSDGNPTVEIKDSFTDATATRSDGSVYSIDGEYVDASRVQAWNNFVDPNNISNVYAVGIGSNVSSQYLELISDNVTMVTDPENLSDTLLSTVIVTSGELNFSFGADGPADGSNPKEDHGKLAFTWGDGDLIDGTGIVAVGATASILWSVSADGLTLTGTVSNETVIKVIAQGIETDNPSYEIVALNKNLGITDLDIPFTVTDGDGDSVSAKLELDIAVLNTVDAVDDPESNPYSVQLGNIDLSSGDATWNNTDSSGNSVNIVAKDVDGNVVDVAQGSHFNGEHPYEIGVSGSPRDTNQVTSQIEYDKDSGKS
ncbi:MAG: DUF4114 domain-containing protein, partial [Campylobacteraceae bacterium]|nr:DUF4114 domain-containing protein [Campylobacteraceae bacterium]